MHMIEESKLNRMINKLENLYQEVGIAESSRMHRIEQRKPLLRLIPKGGIGAEIGVFTGLFSEVLAEICQPEKLYLIDPWDKLHGTHYPNWGDYTNNVRVPTEGAKLAVRIRAEKMSCKSKIVCKFSGDWLRSQDKNYLDWVYLDANHQKDAVISDLNMIHEVVKPNAIISGDDCWVSPGPKFNEVYSALIHFCAVKKYQFIHLDSFGQWAIARSKSTFFLDNVEDRHG